MGKVVEKRKKKGRPSLLDIQKRNLKQQQEEEELRKQQLQHQQLRSSKLQNPNPNNTPVRRSTRRHPNPDDASPAVDDEPEIDEDDDDEADQLIGKRRRGEKLKLVSKLPGSSAKSESFNSGSDSNPEDENTAAASHKRRRIESIGDRSGQKRDDEGGNKHGGSTVPTIAKQGVKLGDGPSAPIPDKKLLLFILDRLQKKDTYGVFAEPVDPEELPDYHEVVQHPIDFSTIRKKLVNGAYVSLEQFEKDVYLLCSNAMQYNAPDTIYFRQARSIQELAKKNFENLRQDSDGNEPEPKVVRRGRPPTKNLKKPPGRPSMERTVSDGTEATLATGVENSTRPNYDIRKASNLDKYASPDSFGRVSYGSRQGEVYISWSAERHDRADELLGSTSKGISMKHGKKQIILDENRRNTYKLSCASANGLDPSSALTVFHAERKQFVPVGLHTEYGYARSLARFAAKLGPVAWKVASKKIEKCLPAGVKFGPGWVGEREPTPRFSSNQTPSAAIAAPRPECNGSKPPEDPKGSGSTSEKQPLSSQPMPNNPEPSSGTGEAVQTCGPSSNTSNGSGAVAIRPGPSFPALVNGVNGTYGLSFPTQTGKPAQSSKSHCAVPPPNGLEEAMVSATSKTEEKPAQSGPQPAPDLKPGSAPPDLNVGFQSPGSPSVKQESVQPDLALQL